MSQTLILDEASPFRKPPPRVAGLPFAQHEGRPSIGKHQCVAFRLLARSLVPIAVLSLVEVAVPLFVTAADPNARDLATNHLKYELELLKRRDTACASGSLTAQDSAVDAQGSIEERMQSRPKGDFSIREKRALENIKHDVEIQALIAGECYKAVNQRRNEIDAILSNPDKLLALGVAILEQQERRAKDAIRAEQERRAAAERLSQELREQWLALLENARRAHETFASGTSYEDFSLRLEAMGKQFQFIRVRYARQLQMGDHKTLGMAVNAAYAALTAATPDWQKERQAASDLAATQATADRYTSIRRPSAMDRANAYESMGRLRDAQQEYEHAKAQLAAKRDSVARLMSEAVRVAKEEREQVQQVSVEARNP